MTTVDFLNPFQNDHHPSFAGEASFIQGRACIADEEREGEKLA